MSAEVSFELSFHGGSTNKSEIDLYDVAQALLGFHRSLALTTHLVLNNEIITQAPSLDGASIFAQIPEEGSWKIPARAVIFSSALYTLGTAPADTAIGHLVFSAYDFVVHQSLGFHIDFDESLGESYEALRRNDTDLPALREYRFDSLIEKCESSIKELHRPIMGQGTADSARIKGGSSPDRLQLLGKDLTADTYEYVHQSLREPIAKRFLGRISSYNANTFNGRVFIPSIGFPVPFHLQHSARTPGKTLLIVNSLMSSTQRADTGNEAGEILLIAESIVSKSGRLKKIEVIDVRSGVQ